MGLVPAILVPCPQPRPVVQQGLAASSVAPCQDSVVQRGQATAVSVVWRSSEGQENLERQKYFKFSSYVFVCFCESGFDVWSSKAT